MHPESHSASEVHFYLQCKLFDCVDRYTRHRRKPQIGLQSRNKFCVTRAKSVRHFAVKVPCFASNFAYVLQFSTHNLLFSPH